LPENHTAPPAANRDIRPARLAPDPRLAGSDLPGSNADPLTAGRVKSGQIGLGAANSRQPNFQPTSIWVIARGDFAFARVT